MPFQDKPPPKVIDAEAAELTNNQLKKIEKNVIFVMNDGETQNLRNIKAYRARYPNDERILIACGEAGGDEGYSKFAGRFDVREDNKKEYFVVTELQRGGAPIDPPTLRDCAQLAK